jgi:hypothetical protein
VRITVREDDDIARDELDLLLPEQSPVAATRGQNVVGDEVLGRRHDAGSQLPGSQRDHAPRLRRLDGEEERAVQPDHTKQVREGVHGVKVPR